MPVLQLPRRLAFPRNPSFMLLLCSVAVAVCCALLLTRPVASFTLVPSLAARSTTTHRRLLFLSSSSSSRGDAPGSPANFREAEVLGLTFMQDRDYDAALKAFTTGLKLPGSRSDVVRTKSLSGPSPVGGAMGGLESQAVLSLDEFELQAAHYNMACAHAQLGNLDDALGSLEMAFQAGFDNYATVRGDADLDPIKSQGSFDTLMETYEPKKGFNPFGLFGGK